MCGCVSQCALTRVPMHFSASGRVVVGGLVGWVGGSGRVGGGSGRVGGGGLVGWVGGLVGWVGGGYIPKCGQTHT